MKYIIAAVVLLLGSITCAIAAPNASLYVASIHDAIRDINILNKEGTKLQSEQAHQLDTADLLMRAVTTHEKDLATHNAWTDQVAAEIKQQRAYAKDVNQQADSYNGTCSGTVDQNTYNWCSSERSRIQPMIDKVNEWKVKVDDEASKVNAERDTINQDAATLNQAVKEFDVKGYAENARGKEYFKKYYALVQRIKDFEAKIKALNDQCSGAVGSAEKVSETCGQMFDGNAVHQTETNYPIPDPTFKPYDAPEKCSPQHSFCYGPIKN